MTKFRRDPAGKERYTDRSDHDQCCQKQHLNSGPQHILHLNLVQIFAHFLILIFQIPDGSLGYDRFRHTIQFFCHLFHYLPSRLFRYGKPMVYAKKAKSDNIEGGLYQSEIFSYTYKKKVTLLVSKEWLHPGDRVLVIDDFLARGEALRGLCEIVQAAGAELVGIGCAVEKGFQGGGDKLRAAGVNLHSLAIIESAEPGNIVFREEEA